jgi:hypothetical protein
MIKLSKLSDRFGDAGLVALLATLPVVAAGFLAQSF